MQFLREGEKIKWDFLCGLITGLFVGCLVGVIVMALAAISITNFDDSEQAKYYSGVNKENAKDRNEF